MFFFFNDTATTEIYTLSLHDALPISDDERVPPGVRRGRGVPRPARLRDDGRHPRKPRLPERRIRPLRGPLRRPELRRARERRRSEEHTSELQSRQYLVCRLLLEKKTN